MPLVITNNFLLKKLDLISGDINRIASNVKDIFASIKKLLIFSKQTLDNTDVIITWLINLQDKSSLEFRKVRIDNIIVKGDIKSVNIDNLQQVTYILEAKDRKGNPAKVESVTWESTDTSIATAHPNPDNPLECTFKAVAGAKGVTIARATADVRFGEEVLNKVAEDALNVTDPEAEILSLANSGAVDQ